MAKRTQDDAALTALGLEAPPKRRALWIGAAVVLALALAFAGYRATRKDDGPRYRTAPVTRGDLAVTITATGTVKGLDTVEVGPEISGRILRVHVEKNAQVKQGDLLVSLDTEQLAARVEEASAQVQAAEAAVRNARATAAEARQKARRAGELAGKGLVSRDEHETAEASLLRADAAVATAEAQLTVSRATLKASRSALSKAEIRAPMDGVVLSRSVEPGQTVAASLQTPVLFVLAKDLTKMALHVQVDEADVGAVQAGQPATFTVDAHPGKRFEAVVKDVSFYPTAQAATASAVVTYEAELLVDNKDLLLRPGMTATASIATAQRKGVLLVPNAALRFAPPEVTAARRPGPSFGLPGMRRGGNNRPRQQPKDAQPGGEVWVLEAGQPVSVPVRAGPTDGRHTELLEGELAEGAEVLVDLVEEPA